MTMVMRKSCMPSPIRKSPKGSDMFVVFEGGDGVGKSTQIARVSGVLKAKGIAHITTREPGGTPASEAVRSALLYEKNQPWPLWAEVFLLAAARAHHVTHVIRPALLRGDWVLCDRFGESTRAYQHQAYGEDPALFEAILAQATGGLRPDLTFIFQLGEGERLSRRAPEEGDCFESRNAAFQNKINQHFEYLSHNPPAGYVFLNAAEPMETLTDAIIAIMGVG
jgi:dTMP kinase